MKTYSHEAGNERLVSISCNLCGSDKIKKGWDCGSYSFQRCAGCGVYYQNPQPRQDELLERYDEDYFSYEIENEKSFFELQLLSLKDIGFDGLFNGNNEIRKFMDIGCATGLLLDRQRGLGWNVQGVEVCRPSAEFGVRERGLDIFIGTLEQARFPHESFDVIHLSHLIEHLNKPLDFLQEVARVLKPGGWILVTTPNTSGLQARWFQANWRSAIADHLYLFSKKNLARALRQAGFEVKREKTWGGLAKGFPPQTLKPFLDRFAKLAGWGDVVLLAGQKLAS